MRTFYCAIYGADMNGFRSLSRNRDFTTLWVGETVNELGRMSDRELNDLGIGRADIRRVARTAVGF